MTRIRRMAGALLLALCAALTACGKAQLPVVVVREETFIAQCREIAAHVEQYQEKRVRIEGICAAWESSNGKVNYMVYRNIAGQEEDSKIGFLFLYDGEAAPQDGDWIAVEGKVQRVAMGQGMVNAITEAEVEVLSIRGAEMVAH